MNPNSCLSRIIQDRNKEKAENERKFKKFVYDLMIRSSLDSQQPTMPHGPFAQKNRLMTPRIMKLLDYSLEYFLF